MPGVKSLLTNASVAHPIKTSVNAGDNEIVVERYNNEIAAERNSNEFVEEVPIINEDNNTAFAEDGLDNESEIIPDVDNSVEPTKKDDGFGMNMNKSSSNDGAGADLSGIEEAPSIMPGGCVRDPSFVQQTSSPVFINPAFAGSIKCSRLSLSYRNQYVGYDHSNVATYYLSYDQYVKKLRGGIGVVSYFQNGGKGATQSWYNGLIYSPKINVKDKFLVEPAVQIGYYHKKLNVGKLNDGNNLDPAYNYDYDNQSFTASGNNYNTGFLDVSAGLVVSNKKFFTGISVDHLTQPAQKFTNGENLPSRYIVQAGTTFRGQRGIKRQFGFSPMIQLTYESYSNPRTRLMWSSTFHYRWLVWGVGAANRDWLIAMVGAEAGKFRFGYSYDSTLEGVSKGSGGSHELSMRYLFNCKDNKPAINSGNPIR